MDEKKKLPVQVQSVPLPKPEGRVAKVIRTLGEAGKGFQFVGYRDYFRPSSMVGKKRIMRNRKKRISALKRLGFF